MRKRKARRLRKTRSESYLTLGAVMTLVGFFIVFTAARA